MLRKYLPNLLNIELFGDRDRYGKQAWSNDQDWAEWNKSWASIYQETQHNGRFLSLINNAGYNILKNIDMTGREVAEIGPGKGYHFKFFKGKPKKYSVVDVTSHYFLGINKYFSDQNVASDCFLVDSYQPEIPLESNSQDIFLSFYSLEHMHPYSKWLEEIFRVIKPGGMLVGAIPTEGGFLWGLGRWLTSRKVLKEQHNLDMKKIICWSHPNMCDEVVREFSQYGDHVYLSTWPVPKFTWDLSLIIKFLVIKR